MSRLVDYGPGEVVDRLSILALKLLTRATVSADQAAAWEREQRALDGQLQPFEAQIDTQLRHRLAAVNQRIWAMEDTLRRYRASSAGGEVLRIVALACDIQAANDERASLIHQINVQAGDRTPPDKGRTRASQPTHPQANHRELAER